MITDRRSRSNRKNARGLQLVQKIFAPSRRDDRRCALPEFWARQCHSCRLPFSCRPPRPRSCNQSRARGAPPSSPERKSVRQSCRGCRCCASTPPTPSRRRATAVRPARPRVEWGAWYGLCCNACRGSSPTKTDLPSITEGWTVGPTMSSRRCTQKAPHSRKRTLFGAISGNYRWSQVAQRQRLMQIPTTYRSRPSRCRASRRWRGRRRSGSLGTALRSPIGCRSNCCGPELARGSPSHR